MFGSFVCGMLVGVCIGIIFMAALSMAEGDTGRAAPPPDPDLERQIGEALHPSRAGLE